MGAGAKPRGRDGRRAPPSKEQHHAPASSSRRPAHRRGTRRRQRQRLRGLPVSAAGSAVTTTWVGARFVLTAVRLTTTGEVRLIAWDANLP
ncbi:hypothetical protein D7V93_02880 [Corallococcus llansteffanensis]|uniref:Uncharacterized protein n=1 Tax=Corallococcus llansteffanensis TaxID=2316731 RepID=A0A3A8QFR7_9BACT|nr:hypothetical protein D7V93_02880 [Corallococcus llansteffanensis]